MAASFTLPTVLANLTAGNQALSLIDGDLTTLRDPLLSLNTFSNFYTDTGAANAYVITVSSPQTVSQAAGLRVQFLAANANTGASTLQINALAAKSILNPDGTALSKGQIAANQIVDVIYDGTQYLLLGASYTTGTWTPSVGGTATYTTQTGVYTKIGRQVTCYGTLTINAIGTGSATTISGLPFTIAAGSNAGGYVSFWSGLLVNATGIVLRAAASGTSMLITGVTVGAANSSTLAALQNGASLEFTITYFV